MPTIDYEKYSNMSQRQLLNSLLNAEKREQKIKFQMQEKLSQTQELIKFLKTKMKESLDKPKFVPYEQSGLPELAREIEKQFTPQELEQIRQEVKQDMMRGDDEL